MRSPALLILASITLWCPIATSFLSPTRRFKGRKFDVAMSLEETGTSNGPSRRDVLRSLGAFAAATSQLGPDGCVAGDVIASAATQVYNGEIYKSQADKRQYRALTLSNGMDVLIVTDPQAEIAAAALDVHVGTYSDPTKLPGLAHFTEHMIFLGNAAFPEEGSFSSYLSANGGSSNAFTADEDTCFFFDIALPSSAGIGGEPQDRAAESLFLGADGGLNRFANFFVSPSFTPSAAAREINAVDSEHRKNLQQDVWRLGQLEKAVRANPDHPAFKFGTGYKETLSARGDELRAALLTFWRRYYIAPQMTLAVVSRLPVEKVQTAVEEYFKAVPHVARIGDGVPSVPMALKPSNERPEDEWISKGIPAYRDTSDAPFAILAKPVAPVRNIKILWHIPRPNVWGDNLKVKGGNDGALSSDSPEVAYARDLLGKPGQIVSNLLGHEGNGSLLYFLERTGVANGLACGSQYESTDIQTFEVNIDLTLKGLEVWEDVAALVFGYLELLRTTDVPRYFMDECVSLAALAWRFSERSEPPSYASALAENMQTFRYRANSELAPSFVSSSETKSRGAEDPHMQLLGPARYLDGGRLYLQLSSTDDVAKGTGRQYNSAPLASSEYLRPLVDAFLDKLDPSRASITIVAPEFVVDGVRDLTPKENGSGLKRIFPKLSKREKWYSTPYTSVNTVTAPITDLPAQIFLPPPNEFIPTKFDFKARLIGAESRRSKELSAVARKELIRAPDLFRETDRWRFYFKQDKSFGQPKAFLTVLVASPAVSADADALVFSKLWRLALIDRLSTDVYSAALAGLGFDFDITARGVRLSVFGYDEKLTDFVSLLATAVTSFDMENPYQINSSKNDTEFETSEQTFERQRELLRRELESFDTNQPYQHCKYWEATITERPHYSKEALRSSLERATLSKVAAHARFIWQDTTSSHLSNRALGKALLQGNLSPSDAAAIFSTLENELVWKAGPILDDESAGNKLGKRWALLPTKRCALVPTFDEMLNMGYIAQLPSINAGRYPTIVRPPFDVRNINSAVEFVWQIPETQNAFFEAHESVLSKNGLQSSVSEELPCTWQQWAATADVYGTLLEQPVFESLRTKQQLGYIVFSGIRNADGVRSFVIIVQSSKYSASELHECVANFMEGLEDGFLASLTSEDVKRTASGLVEKKLVREKRLVTQVGRHWDEIISGTFEWDRAATEADALRKVDLKSILAFHRTFVSPRSHLRRVIAYHVNANVGSMGSQKTQSPSMKMAPILDTTEFSTSLSLLPVRDIEARELK